MARGRGGARAYWGVLPLALIAVTAACVFTALLRMPGGSDGGSGLPLSRAPAGASGSEAQRLSPLHDAVMAQRLVTPSSLPPMGVSSPGPPPGPPVAAVPLVGQGAISAPSSLAASPPAATSRALTRLTPPPQPCSVLRTMCKWREECWRDAKPGNVVPLLITGVGASGTLSMLNKLASFGFRLGGEEDAADGVVGWPARCDGPPAGVAHMARGHGAVGWHFLRSRARLVMHQVRHPLKVLGSYQGFSVNMATPLNQRVWRYIEAFTEAPGTSFRNAAGDWAHPILRSAEHWVTWNEAVERVADFRYQAEDPRAAVEVCAAVLEGVPPAHRPAGFHVRRCAKELEREVDLHSHGGHKKRYAVTWEALEELNATLAQRVWKTAQRYGYGRVPPTVARPKVMRAADSAHDSARAAISLAVPGARVEGSQPAYAKHYPEYAFDGSDTTYYWAEVSGEEGDGVTVTLPVARSVSALSALTGKAGGGDVIRHALLQVAPPPPGGGDADVLHAWCSSLDTEYVTVGSVQGKARVEAAAEHPALASVQCVRVAVGGNQAEWLAVREVHMT